MTILEENYDKKLERILLTPEGVPLHIFLGARSERAAAFLFDIIIQFAAIALFSIALFVALGPTIGLGWAIAIITFVYFLLRVFYFSFFELTWKGRTPGKRALGLRVIDRHGGTLTPEAILTRNFMREVEIFLPLSILSTTATNAGQQLSTLLLSIWVCIFAFLPLFNRDSLRVGDLVAGTWVIRNPKTIMIHDLAAGQAPSEGEVSPYQFTAAQLSIYGIKELQVLEDVLRHKGDHALPMQDEVAKRIQNKISWDPAGVPGYSNLEFLTAFYRALRKQLEGSMIMGQRKESKTDV